MEIEKTLVFAAPPGRVWALLLDPQAMSGCVPGMKSIEVLSDDEYIAHMHVKISFISAKFKLKTRIVERNEPHYLRAEGTGEDTAVASSLKQTSEMWLEARADGGTDLRMKVKVDVFGRMGAFGLSVMKTKADRMWDEFGVNAAAQLAGGQTPAPAAAPAAAAPLAAALPAAPAAAAAPSPMPAPAAPSAAAVLPAAELKGTGWWGRLLGLGNRPAGTGRCIQIEIRRGDAQYSIQWPVEAAAECGQWLDRALRP